MDPEGVTPQHIRVGSGGTTGPGPGTTGTSGGPPVISGTGDCTVGDTDPILCLWSVRTKKTQWVRTTRT